MNPTKFGQARRLESHHRLSKLVHDSPPSFATPLGYYRLQHQPAERILDDPDDYTLPPISLLYEGFGRFVDIVDWRAKVPEVVEQRMVEREVDVLIRAMTAAAQDGTSRQRAVVSHLGEILSCVRGRCEGDDAPLESRSCVELSSVVDMPMGENSNSGKRQQNVSCVYGPHEAIVLAQKTDLSVQPSFDRQASVAELVAHVARSNCLGMLRYPSLYRGWQVPALALVVFGKAIQFYAIVHLEQYRVVPLSSIISLIPRNKKERRKIYDVFKAATFLHYQIHCDILTRIRSRPLKIPWDRRRLPPITTSAPWPRKPGSGSPRITFSLDAPHLPQHSRCMYKGHTSTGEQILVKFTRNYCPELHDFCSGIGYTPKLLGFEQLPGGWFIVVMPLIPSHYISTAPGVREHLRRWKEEVQMVVDGFHKVKLVHADLRDANILVEDGGERHAMVIDFDWGGRDGWVSYPRSNLHDELTDGRTRQDLVVTKEDDLRILDITFRKLECQSESR